MVFRNSEVRYINIFYRVMQSFGLADLHGLSVSRTFTDYRSRGPSVNWSAPIPRQTSVPNSMRVGQKPRKYSSRCKIPPPQFLNHIMPLPWQRTFCHCRKMCLAHLHPKENICVKFYEFKNWGSSSRRKICNGRTDRPTTTRWFLHVFTPFKLRLAGV